jgi:hypothetical protein
VGVSTAVVGQAKDKARSYRDLHDDSADPQVHVMYVLPSDGVDLQLDEDGTIAGSVSAFEEWFAGQTGGMRLRLDTHKGNLDITFAQLTRTDSQMAAYGLNLRDEVESELLASGFNAANKLYLVYYGGTNLFACGGAPLPPVLMGNYAVLYLNGMPPGAPPCASNSFASFPDTPGYWEFSGVHELVHAQGFVVPCAPHFVLAGHVSDSDGPHVCRYRTLATLRA